MARSTPAVLRTSFSDKVLLPVSMDLLWCGDSYGTRHHRRQHSHACWTVMPSRSPAKFHIWRQRPKHLWSRLVDGEDLSPPWHIYIFPPPACRTMGLVFRKNGAPDIFPPLLMVCLVPAGRHIAYTKAGCFLPDGFHEMFPVHTSGSICLSCFFFPVTCYFLKKFNSLLPNIIPCKFLFPS